MTSDIKLDGEWLIVEGKWTRLQTHDLMLDASERRENNQGVRRALVHDPRDGLTINWNKDYPDGVKIQGYVKVEEGISTRDIRIIPEESREAVIPSYAPPPSYPTGGGTWGLEGSLTHSFSLLHELRKLNKRITELTEEVETLKQKVADLEG